MRRYGQTAAGGFGVWVDDDRAVVVHVKQGWQHGGGVDADRLECVSVLVEEPAAQCPCSGHVLAERELSQRGSPRVCIGAGEEDGQLLYGAGACGALAVAEVRRQPRPAGLWRAEEGGGDVHHACRGDGWLAVAGNGQHELGDDGSGIGSEVAFSSFQHGARAVASDLRGVGVPLHPLDESLAAQFVRPHRGLLKTRPLASGQNADSLGVPCTVRVLDGCSATTVSW